MRIKERLALRSIRVCVALLIALLTAGPLTVEGTTAQAPGEPIVVAGLPNDSSAEMYYAADKGFYQKAGLNVKLLTLPAGAISSAVISGTAAIGTLTVPAVALAREKKIPLVIIAPASMYSSASPTSGLIVLKDSPYRKAADLDGKVVATRDLANLSYYGALAWIDKNGGDAKSIKWVEVPDPEDVAAMQRGRVDAGSVSEPALGEALHGEARMLGAVYDAIAPRFLIACYFTTQQYAAAHPDVVRAFANAILEAGRWANRNRAESAKIVGKYAGAPISPSVTRVTYAERIHAEDAQPVVDMLSQYGVLKTPMRATDLWAAQVLGLGG